MGGLEDIQNETEKKKTEEEYTHTVHILVITLCITTTKETCAEQILYIYIIMYNVMTE